MGKSGDKIINVWWLTQTTNVMWVASLTLLCNHFFFNAFSFDNQSNISDCSTFREKNKNNNKNVRQTRDYNTQKERSIFSIWVHSFPLFYFSVSVSLSHSPPHTHTTAGIILMAWWFSHLASGYDQHDSSTSGFTNSNADRNQASNIDKQAVCSMRSTGNQVTVEKMCPNVTLVNSSQ